MTTSCVSYISYILFSVSWTISVKIKSLNWFTVSGSAIHSKLTLSLCTQVLQYIPVYTLKCCNIIELPASGSPVHSSWHIQVFQCFPSCTIKLSSTLKFVCSGTPKHSSSPNQNLQHILGYTIFNTLLLTHFFQNVSACTLVLRYIWTYSLKFPHAFQLTYLCFHYTPVHTLGFSKYSKTHQFTHIGAFKLGQYRKWGLILAILSMFPSLYHRICLDILDIVWSFRFHQMLAITDWIMLTDKLAWAKEKWSKIPKVLTLV